MHRYNIVALSLAKVRQLAGDPATEYEHNKITQLHIITSGAEKWDMVIER